MTDLKYEFSEWIKDQKNKKGKLFTPITIKDYVYALEKHLKCIQFDNLVENNLFSYTILNDFMPVYLMLRNDSDLLKKISEKYGNRALSSAINYYKKFLEERE